MADARASATGEVRPRAISAPSDLRRGSVLGHLAMPEFPQAPTSAPLALPALSASQRKLNARAADKPLDEPPRRQAPLFV